MKTGLIIGLVAVLIFVGVASMIRGSYIEQDFLDECEATGMYIQMNGGSRGQIYDCTSREVK